MHDLELLLCTQPVHANLTPLLDQLAAWDRPRTAPHPRHDRGRRHCVRLAITERPATTSRAVALIEWLGNPFDPAL